MYNDYLNNERLQIQKHFLKKRLKSAFEREPIDKCKSFFNVPFIPTVNMFAVPNPNPQPQNPSNPQINSNPSGQVGTSSLSAQNGSSSSNLPNKAPTNNPSLSNNATQPQPQPQSNSNVSGGIRVNLASTNGNQIVDSLKQGLTKIETNPQRKNEIFSTTNRSQIAPPENSQSSSVTLPGIGSNSQVEDKKIIDPEVKSEYNTRITIPLTSGMTPHSAPQSHQSINHPISHQMSQSQSNQIASQLINNLTASSLYNNFKNSAQNQELNKMLKEKGLNFEQFENLRNTGILQGGNFLKQTYQQQVHAQPQNNNYPRNNYQNMNVPAEIEGNSVSNPNYFIENQLKPNKLNINANIIKALKETGNIQILQNIEKANFNLNQLGGSYGGQRPDLMNNPLYQEISGLSQGLQGNNMNFIAGHRPQQYPMKQNNMYIQQGGMKPGVHGLNTSNNNGMNGTSSQSQQTGSQKVTPEDILNSFNLNNNYD